MGLKFITKVLGKEFEENPFSKGFSSRDTCKTVCVVIAFIDWI